MKSSFVRLNSCPRFLALRRNSLSANPNGSAFRLFARLFLLYTHSQSRHFHLPAWKKLLLGVSGCPRKQCVLLGFSLLIRRHYCPHPRRRSFVLPDVDLSLKPSLTSRANGNYLQPYPLTPGEGECNREIFHQLTTLCVRS